MRVRVRVRVRVRAEIGEIGEGLEGEDIEIGLLRDGG